MKYQIQEQAKQAFAIGHKEARTFARIAADSGWDEPRLVAEMVKMGYLQNGKSTAQTLRFYRMEMAAR